MVTVLSSTSISLVRKSAPIVALYSLLNFFCTYWFIKLVCGRSGGVGQRERQVGLASPRETAGPTFPTPLSPRMMTFSSLRCLRCVLAIDREARQVREAAVTD